MASSYIRKAVNPKTLKKIACETNKVVKATGASVIVSRGLSGNLIAAAVGAKYGVPFAIIRKPNEGSHSSEAIELSAWSAKYHDWIIVDDFISSGATVQAIAQEVSNDSAFSGRCVGIVLYNEYSDRTEFQIAGATVPIFKIEV